MGRLTHRTGRGFTYFVTTKTWQNRTIFQVAENAEILIDSLFRYRNKDEYLLHEFVVMPDHLHVLLTPGQDTSLERAIMLIKGGSSHEIRKRREVRLEIWQAGFHEESIRDIKDYAGKTEYIDMNPVRSGLIERPEEWPYGSACKKFQMDAAPERLKILTSGAKAPSSAAAGMSDLKVGPPKNSDLSPSARSQLNSSSSEQAVALPSGAKAPSCAAAGMSDLKVRPPKNLGDAPLSEVKLRPPKNL